MSDAAYSLTFLNAVAELATRLAVDRIAVYKLRYDYPAFGSWELVAGRRHSRVRIVWDGKGAALNVYAAHIRNAADEPNWQLESEQDFSKKRSELAELFGAIYTAIRQRSDV